MTSRALFFSVALKVAKLSPDPGPLLYQTAVEENGHGNKDVWPSPEKTKGQKQIHRLEELEEASTVESCEIAEIIETMVCE